ncbi:MAG: AAA family ATPase [Candidatus Hodarchaeota archaeon]
MHYFMNFKGFREAKLNLFEPLTVLVGPNGSGKSNVIEGMELFSFIAHGRPLHEIVDVGRSESNLLQVRGGLQNCPTYGHDSFSMKFSASIRFQGVNRDFSYSVIVRVTPAPRIAGETLAFEDGTMIFQTIEGRRGATSDDIAVEFNNFARGGKKPQVPVSRHRSVLSQYKQFAKSNKKFAACEKLVDRIMHYLRSSFVFDPNPKLMRRYERIGNEILTRDGANLSAVLYALHEGNQKEKKTLTRLLERISQLPEEPYQDFAFVTTELNDVIFGFVRSKNEPIHDARVLSDGTLRSLAVLAALETVDPFSRVVIEEFDNGLHPSRVNVLLEAIRSCCERRNLNILITTHNPAALNALQPNQLKGVVLCTWDSLEASFKLVNLFELPRCDELLERGRLGDLVTRRVVEQYFAPEFEKKHKEKALAWMRKLA